MRKADQFSKDFDAEVYVLIYRDRKFYTYSSTEDEQWPPSLTQIVSACLTLTRCQLVNQNSTEPFPKDTPQINFHRVAPSLVDCSMDQLQVLNALTVCSLLSWGLV